MCYNILMGLIYILLVIAGIGITALIFVSLWADVKAEENPTTRKLYTIFAVCLTIMLAIFVFGMFV